MADADPKLTPRTEGRVKAQLEQSGSRTVAALGGAAGRSKELVDVLSAHLGKSTFTAEEGLEALGHDPSAELDSHALGAAFEKAKALADALPEPAAPAGEREQLLLPRRRSRRCRRTAPQRGR